MFPRVRRAIGTSGRGIRANGQYILRARTRDAEFSHNNGQDDAVAQRQHLSCRQNTHMRTQEVAIFGLQCDAIACSISTYRETNSHGRKNVEIHQK